VKSIFRHSLAGLASLTLVAVAGPATALSVYADVFTAEGFGNFHAQATLTLDTDGWIDPFSLDLSAEIVGSGLGDPSLAEGESKSVTHVFNPSDWSGGVEKAWVGIWVADDFDDLECTGLFNCYMEDEVALIEIGGEAFLKDPGGSFLGSFAVANVSGEIQNVGDEVITTVSAQQGDFEWRGSGLLVKGGEFASQPIPEPTAVLVFLIGALIVQGRVRRS